MQNQINLSPLTQFVQQVRSAELSQAKEVKLSIQQARLINLALVEIMDKLVQDYESMYNSLKKHVDADDAVVNVSMDGGGFEQ
jgi:hypothetical protein